MSKGYVPNATCVVCGAEHYVAPGNREKHRTCSRTCNSARLHGLIGKPVRIPLSKVPPGTVFYTEDGTVFGKTVSRRNGTAVVAIEAPDAHKSRRVIKRRAWSSEIVVRALMDEPEPEEVWEVRGAPSHGLVSWVSSEGNTMVLEAGETPPGRNIYGWS